MPNQVEYHLIELIALLLPEVDSLDFSEKEISEFKTRIWSF